MEMPNNCGECQFICKESTCRYGKGYERSDFCPLVEVKPHGGLIDVDTLRHWILTEMASLDSEEDREFVADRLANELPTIIEAEEGET